MVWRVSRAAAGAAAASSRPARKPIRREEEPLHIACADFLRVALPPPFIFFHVPNEGQRHVAGHAAQQRMGRVDGWPDLTIYGGCGLDLVELKPPKYRNRKNGGLSDEQVETHRRLSLVPNTRVAVCYSVEELEHQLLRWRYQLIASVLPTGAIIRGG